MLNDSNLDDTVTLAKAYDIVIAVVPDKYLNEFDEVAKATTLLRADGKFVDGEYKFEGYTQIKECGYQVEVYDIPECKVDEIEKSKDQVENPNDKVE